VSDPAGFKVAFRKAVSVIPGVERVEYFGSIETSRFRPGMSDVDIIIHGHVSPRDKVRIWELLKELNTTYRLGLETAPFLHPTPFYIDSKAKEVMFRALFNGHAIVAFGPYRALGKRFAPSYGAVWRGEAKLDKVFGRLKDPLKEAFFSFT
jgi:predicted nucleotidyltransferase